MLKVLAILILSSSPAWANQMLCAAGASNKEFLANLEKNAGETLRFVGVTEGGVPMEFTMSPDGSWSIVIQIPQGMCFLAAGKNGQTVEPKPAGTEN